LESVRRLTITKQRLQGRLPAKVTSKSILSVVRDLAYVQWDPVPIVAPSHLLSLWCRLGSFPPALLERMLWDDKSLMEHWTPMASIVLTEDYPLYQSLMSRYPESLSHSWGNHRTRAKKFLADHVELRRRMLGQLKDEPRSLSGFQDHLRTRRADGEWSFSSDVSQMLFHLHMSGKVMVVGHERNQNIWGLSEEFLPSGTPRTELSEEAAERVAAERAIRALGTATPAEITYYFVRGRYERLRTTLAGLVQESAIHRVHVEGLGGREERYVHEREVRLLESGGARSWQPRVSLLPPFDNLICSQARTKRIFGFDYVREQFLPREKRKFGTYVLPILSGDSLIGRIDPRFDRASGKLVINSVHAEPAASDDQGVAAEIGVAIERLAGFVGAEGVSYSSQVPPAWKSSLH